MTTVQERLRHHAATLRTNSMPLKDLIPLLNQTADALDRLRADAERLNFLDKNLHWKMGWRVKKAPAGCLSVGPVVQLGGVLTNIREAIDAAMKETP